MQRLDKLYIPVIMDLKDGNSKKIAKAREIQEFSLKKGIWIMEKL